MANRSAGARGGTADPAAAVLSGEGRLRAVIDRVLPAIDAGRFAVKAIAGKAFQVEAHCFADGHDKLRVRLAWQALAGGESGEVEMAELGNDVWRCEWIAPVPGRYRYTVQAWVDHFRTWYAELERRDELEDVRLALQVGAALIEQAAARAEPADQVLLLSWAAQLHSASHNPNFDLPTLRNMALDSGRANIAERYSDRSLAASHSLELVADRPLAQFSAWYEFFPRSSGAAGGHGNFRDAAARLPAIAALGFDVIYFPPIHPIGRINRKGPNNTLSCGASDVGSPWAIGAAEGGHTAIHPQLGTLQEFQDLLGQASVLGLQVALDIAFQCAPDHPYVSQHPQWFKHRPDGSIQYAENPPKKYQDIYPFDFETEDWRALWNELRRVFEFWIEQGVQIFRVDNPHTKAFAFWEWVIRAIKDAHPQVLFLAEAFTRPKVMHRLAKLGFSQSYTYFTWRNSKQELIEFFTELTTGPGRDYFRPNVWPNTPDILHETLQSGSRAVFVSRLILATTLAANYGIYGPAYELLESVPREAGSEEYRDSEKYQLRHWNLDKPESLAPLIGRLNHIRRENPALQADHSLRFCRVDNDQLLAYVKSDAATGNAILTVVNLDPHQTQAGWVELDLELLQLDAESIYQVHDLISDQHFIWHGRRNFVMLDPAHVPAHIFRLRQHLRTEHNFDYFL